MMLSLNKRYCILTCAEFSKFYRFGTANATYNFNSCKFLKNSWRPDLSKILLYENI